MAPSFSAPHLLRRWAGPLLAGMAFLLMLLLMAVAFLKWGDANVFVTDGAKNPVMKAFAIKAVLTEILPVYAGTGFLLFILGILPLRFGWMGAGRWNDWTGPQGFWIAFGLLGMVHLYLWWEVPTTLWVLPGLSALPMGLSLAILLVAFLACGWFGLGTRLRPTPLRTATLFLFWGVLCFASIRLPRHLARVGLDAPPSGHPARVLMLSIDGLRENTAFEQGFGDLEGFKVENGYTAIPATRLEWSILWGGDPGYYSVGHVMPSLDELQGHRPYEILEQAKAQGLKTRFFIDDGGTIGLVDKEKAFDEVGMPARGWENFLNSNMAVHVPLYANWLDALRVFPTTTPWTPLDLALRRTLSEGRGADWVIFHSCLAHQPIFLDRRELGAYPHWWTIRAADLAPTWNMPSASRLKHFKPEYSPYAGYQIRIAGLISTWGRIWNQLGKDPDYGPALRIFMTDHGERFYHLTPEFQAGGMHGYNLDPWEGRIPLAFAGPGIPSGRDDTHALSLLQVRDFVATRLLTGQTPDLKPLLAEDTAFIRLHAMDTITDPKEGSAYRQMNAKDIIDGSQILPDGVWVMKYKESAEQRGEDLTLAEAHGDLLDVYRPLKKGGARHFRYRGYDQVGTPEDLTEAEFQAVRARINAGYLRHWKLLPPAS